MLHSLSELKLELKLELKPFVLRVGTRLQVDAVPSRCTDKHIGTIMNLAFGSTSQGVVIYLMNFNCEFLAAFTQL